MKTGSILLLITTACALANPLKPKGDAAAPMTLVENGQPKYTIVTPADGSPVVRKAAQDLNHWLKEITGTDLARKGGPVIRVVVDPKLADEAYRIGIEGDDLLLAGGAGRGVINAVYAFLEEDLGCRFYTNDDIKLPKTTTLTVSVVPRTYAPKLMLRDPFYFASFDPVWSLRNRTNAPDAKVPEEFGGHVDYGGLFVHTAAGLLSPDKYFKDHPEYFIQTADGNHSPAQWCSTNAEVAKIVTQNVLDILARSPNTEIVSISKNDSGGDQICHCPTCEKLRKDEGTEMANQLVLVNHVAEAVEKTHPKVLVDTLAYLDTIGVPKTLRPRKNVIIRVCNDTVGSWSRPFTNARDLPVAAITKQWAGVHDKLSIWDYNINFSHFLAPMPNMDVIADNIRFWIDNHAVGVMTQGGYQSTSERDEMRSWVIAKLMWDPTLDVNALVEDFTLGHYGAAGPALMEYESLLAASRKADAKELDNPPGGIRYPMTIALFSKDFLSKASDIFEKAKRAASDDPTILHRVERAELPILYVKLSQGPVTADLLDRFEEIAKREKVDWLLEWQTRLDAQLVAWRKQLPPPATAPATKQAAAPSTQPIVISKGKEAYTYQAFPDACRLKNGDIIAVFYAGYTHVSLATDDFPLGGRICMVRSTDDGKTWSEPAVLFDDEADNRDAHIAQLDDGTLVCTFFSWTDKDGKKLKSYKDFNWDYFHKQGKLSGGQLVTSHDNGKTWDTTPKALFADWVSSAPVRQLPDGDCILGIYGTDPKTKLSIGGTMRSDNRGETWEAPVAIKSPPGVSLDAETDIIRMKSGQLFAALRSSTQNMHYSLSYDEGQSWSEAKDIGFKAHCPHLTRLSTGEIIMSHRIPGTAIHVSRDECKTWSGPYSIDTCIGAYPATVELKDGSVLIVYYTEGENSVIRARRFKLNKDGIELLPLG